VVNVDIVNATVVVQQHVIVVILEVLLAMNNAVGVEVADIVDILAHPHARILLHLVVAIAAHAHLLELDDHTEILDRDLAHLLDEVHLNLIAHIAMVKIGAANDIHLNMEDNKLKFYCMFLEKSLYLYVQYIQLFI
jgi:hypothetical protein